MKWYKMEDSEPKTWYLLGDTKTFLNFHLKLAISSIESHIQLFIWLWWCLIPGFKNERANTYLLRMQVLCVDGVYPISS